jgi:tetratricopeptide (TPR) repeat protein
MIRIVGKSSLLAVSFLLFFTGLAVGQTSSLEGRVIGEDGKPLEGALIKIDRIEMKGSYRVKTRKGGDWLYAGLPIGNYRVSVELDGREVDVRPNARASAGGGNPPIVFNLAERKKAQDALQAAAETGTLTAEQTRGLSSEQRAELERALKERQADLGKRKELNDAFNAGMEAMKVQQFQAAVDAFAKAAEVDPKQHVIWAQLAEAYSSLASQKVGAEQEATAGKAVEAFQKAMELKPDEASYYNNYALALVKAKKIPDAQAALEKAAELDPPNAGKYFYNLGAVMMNTGQTDAAGEIFKKAISLTPNYAPAHYQYGLYLIGKAQIGADGKMVPPEGTREELEAYLKLDPNGPNADSARGLLASFDQTIERNYTNPDAKKKAPAPKKK